MPRIVVLGCGTGIGKTWVSVALLQELARTGPALGLKPIESGIIDSAESPPAGSDAAALTRAGSLHVTQRHPLYGFEAAVSPHLAARSLGAEIELTAVVEWVQAAEHRVTPLVSSDIAIWTVLETAGGVFSPLSVHASNYDLALALEPAVWLLVAPDALGVLHEVSATLQAMRARGREPDHLVLSAARTADASTGSNARELTALGIATPSAVLARDDQSGIAGLVRHLLNVAR